MTETQTSERTALLAAHASGLDGFTSRLIDVDDVRLHAVLGGSGPAMVLVHGFPQDWYEWRAVMQRLASQYSVVAVDLRGAGRSEAPADGYSAEQLAADVHGLVHHLGLSRIHLVGHDIGGWVAYAYARLYQPEVAGVAVLETLIPGTARFAAPELDVALWHGEFHMVPGLAEALVEDRQEVYFRYFFDIGTRGADVISDDDLRHYAAAYGDLPHLRAAFETYRAVPQNISFNQRERGPIDVPLTLVGGEHVFGPALPDSAAQLRAEFGWNHVDVRIIAGGQHYVADERPDDVAALLAEIAGPSRDV